jgi:propionate CoA-transferase
MVTLTEVAPGVDLQTQILDQMEFAPVISADLKEMDHGMFQENWGNLQSIITINSKKDKEPVLV